GPAPVLEVTFRHQGSTSSTDIFAVCLEDTDCQSNSPGIHVLANAPTLTKTSTIDLRPHLGESTREVTFLVDTRTESAACTDVKVYSNVDGDALYEGNNGLGGCDACWDADEDFYGDPASPDLSACIVPGVEDCDDTRFSVTPANTTETNCGDGLDNDCDGFTD